MSAIDAPRMTNALPERDHAAALLALASVVVALVVIFRVEQIRERDRTGDLGGDATTEDVTAAVVDRL